ncbi:MAG TPA: FAD-binding oxidoreductase [Thermoleophilaceae bacterium]|jgi:alkyldihydroxyacetonephosphate synthase|nr:FAD-binding oxidoreductase [Thermoleophilaceae bacterium]
MRWWGWGEDGHAVPLPAVAEALLRDELGADPAARRPPVSLEQVSVPDGRLPESARERLAAAVGAEHVRDDRDDRIRHAVGRSYPDLVRIRSGDAASAPDAVVLPASAEQVGAVLAACAEHRIAVVPFGGGTSVVGGVEPVRDGMAATVTLDLGRLASSVEVDSTSLTARLDAGLLGPDAERRLREQGVTLGHFPQSFEYSTVGGWVATRSAGQASTGYGRIDELVEAVRCVTPAGELGTRAVPASAAGPSLRELVVGSEGVLGVICEATLRVRPAPAARRYEGWSFATFAEGRDAFRVMEQAGASADVNRLSDEAETRLSMALASSGSATEKLGRRYLRMRGHEGGCLAIVGFEGDEEEVDDRRRRTGALLRAGGGVALGHRPGDAWLRSRYAAPYLRDELLDRGVLVETLETAATWANLGALHHAVGEALRAALSGRGTPALVMCHVSHLYPSGASLYFTFLARQEEDALAQWRAAKTAASEAIVAGGGTITHHHAIGRDHRQWMRAEVGELGLELLRAAKERLDPAGIMNPGKLLP